jgi:hypothetical protein
MRHRDGKRFVVRADEKLTAFVEIEIRDSCIGNKLFLSQRRTLRVICDLTQVGSSYHDIAPNLVSGQ